VPDFTTPIGRSRRRGTATIVNEGPQLTVGTNNGRKRIKRRGKSKRNHSDEEA
jgi:uncharacterized protein Veg